ncbi:hypothetical protein N5C81_12645 [Rhizobium pusense]|uniref:hypothetical protein n=1 Tax=Agrobacterium pusense TaxID=648995 RepID=UPI00244A8181|nr:hypothetical protein [Agrobacterium pusense]MDH1268468.1 hypothetical protein [Agrobacterium pusense]
MRIVFIDDGPRKVARHLIHHLSLTGVFAQLLHHDADQTDKLAKLGSTPAAGNRTDLTTDRVPEQAPGS